MAINIDAEGLDQDLINLLTQCNNFSSPELEVAKLFYLAHIAQAIRNLTK